MMEWLQLLLPAWIMGTLLVFLTAPLGCLMLWRRMSFFADTMAHGTLLGVAIAGAMALPLWMGVAFIAGLLVAILWVLHDPRLPNDALLALCSATLLCSGLMFIQHIPSLRPELLSYLLVICSRSHGQTCPFLPLLLLLHWQCFIKVGKLKFRSRSILIWPSVKVSVRNGNV